MNDTNDSQSTDASSPTLEKADTSKSPSITLGTLTQSNNFKKIKEFLESNSSTDIFKIKDNRMYTVLHMACVNSQFEIGKLFIDYAKSHQTSKEEFRQWINARTDEGFTPIHFASFKGNLPLIQLLEENGADFHLKNNRGLSVVHIAAQGDRPISLAYFKEKGISILEKDNNGSTPLHWACYFGMENSAFYLTAWGALPNQLDEEFKCTPLHLAANSGNFKVVKRLLSKGGDRTLKNQEGKTPLEIATENDYGAIVDLLEKKDGFAARLGLKAAAIKKKTLLPLYFFVSCFVLLSVLTVLFIFPYVYDEFWIIFMIVVFAVLILTFLNVWLMDPGFIHNRKNGDILALLKKHDPHLICPECIIVKPERSKHCELCHSCVSVFDHHCPWINNCVGARNYGPFLRFITSVLVALFTVLIFACCHVGQATVVRTYLPISEDAMRILKDFSCAVIFVVSLFFIFPLVGLNWLHLVNLLTGKTTHERFAYHAPKNDAKNNLDASQDRSRTQSQTLIDEKSSIAKKPRDASLSDLFKNCRSMCFTNAKEERYNSTTIELL